MPAELVATLHGGKSRKSYRVYWSSETGNVLIERPGGLFGSSRIDTRIPVSSRQMAFLAAEAYLHDK